MPEIFQEGLLNSYIPKEYPSDEVEINHEKKLGFGGEAEIYAALLNDRPIVAKTFKEPVGAREHYAWQKLAIQVFERQLNEPAWEIITPIGLTSSIKEGEVNTLLMEKIPEDALPWDKELLDPLTIEQAISICLEVGLALIDFNVALRDEGVGSFDMKPNNLQVKIKQDEKGEKVLDKLVLYDLSMNSLKAFDPLYSGSTRELGPEVFMLRKNPGIQMDEKETYWLSAAITLRTVQMLVEGIRKHYAMTQALDTSTTPIESAGIFKAQAAKSGLIKLENTLVEWEKEIKREMPSIYTNLEASSGTQIQ